MAGAIRRHFMAANSYSRASSYNSQSLPPDLSYLPPCDYLKSLYSFLGKNLAEETDNQGPGSWVG